MADVISILKEILENSIDAYAENIKIILKNGGQNRIHIIDDGIGMRKNDAIKSFERKIKVFRGEALEIETRYIESDIGIRLIIENGKLKDPLPIAMEKGYSICINNIPAKRKYSKLELKNIINEFYKRHNDINFYLENDNKILLKSYKKRQIFGEKIIKKVKFQGDITNNKFLLNNFLLKQVNVKKLSTREITYFNNEYKKLIKKIK